MIHAIICSSDRERQERIHMQADVYIHNAGEECQFQFADSLEALDRALQEPQPVDLVLVCGSRDKQKSAAAVLKQRESPAELTGLLAQDDEAAVRDKLEKALRRIQLLRSSKLIFKIVGGGVQVVDLKDITFIESTIHVQKVHLQDHSVVEARQTLVSIRELLERKAPGKFVSPSKGFLINQDAIRLIRPDRVEVQAQERAIPLAKRRFRQFQEQYFHYIFGKEGKAYEQGI